jgi:hypothetical protein
MSTDSQAARSPLIPMAGVYDNIPMEAYHGRVEICPGPSVSSSGLRTIENECPYKYWYNSPLNPERPEEEEKAHFQLGKLLHELLAEGPKCKANWHVLPRGFSDSYVKKFEKEIAERDAAVAAGKECIAEADFCKAEAMAARVLTHPVAKLMFQTGTFEPTLAWQDQETGIWCRVRPDFLPKVRQFIPDLKSTVSAHPKAFAKSVDNYGYHMAAALYLEGLRVLFGERPKGFILVAVEKTEPFITELYQIDEEALAFGAVQNRRALRTLADCIEHDHWPTYGDGVNLIGLPRYSMNELEAQTKTGELDVPAFG